VLGRATGNTDTQDSPWPELGGSHHLPPYSILCTSPWGPHPNDFLSRDSQVGVLKSPKLRLLWLWSPIILQAELGSRCGLKQSCIPCRELSNGMSYAICRQVNRVDSWLFMVGSQTANLIPGLSFGHNLCFKCPNEHCKPILNIYVPRNFQWYKERHKPLNLTPEIVLWNFGSPPKLYLPKWELPWECEGSFPHTFLHSREYVMWLPGFFWPAPLQPLYLGREPKARVATFAL